MSGGHPLPRNLLEFGDGSCGLLGCHDVGAANCIPYLLRRPGLFGPRGSTEYVEKSVLPLRNLLDGGGWCSQLWQPTTVDGCRPGVGQT